MQNNIYNYALQKGEFQIETLCSLCDLMEPDMHDRFVTALLGIIDYESLCANLPTTKNIRGKICTIKDFNYLLDTVTYEYEDTCTRYFKDRVEADKYIAEGTGYYASEAKKSEEYNIEATHAYLRTDTCSFARWIAGDEQ